MALDTALLPSSIVLTSDAGDHQAHLRLVPGGPGLCAVELYDPATGDMLAQPIRIKITDSGGKIAADFPGCDSNLVVTDENGHITNG